MASGGPPSEPALPDPASDAATTRGTAPDAEIPAAEQPPGPPAWEALRETELSYRLCRLAVGVMGVRYTEPGPITDPQQRDCGIARPLHVTSLPDGVAVAGGADMRCGTALALGLWLRTSVQPAAVHLPGAPRVVRLDPGSTYQCRAVVGDGGPARMSEHALGNAFDVAGFGLSDGSTLAVAPRADRGDMTAAFQNAVQATACLFFTTVLGPGSNAAHDNHLHLDIKARKGGLRLCQ